MAQSLHPYYKRAAWISMCTTLVSLLPIIAGGYYHELVLRSGMIGLLIGLIIGLLLSLGYNWMKWVMLCFSALSLLSLSSLLTALLDAVFINPLSALIQLQQTVADVVITIMLFKISRVSVVNT